MMPDEFSRIDREGRETRLDTNAHSARADGDVALLRALPKDRLWHIPVVILGMRVFRDAGPSVD